jgi:hypothetical protein
MKKMPSLDNQTHQKISEPVKNSLGILLLFGIAIAFFYPLLFDNKVIFYRDFHFITYPFRNFLSQAYHQGAMPYWTPNVYGGMPFLSAFHPGVFYPPSVILFLPDTISALNLFYLLHYLVLGIFTYLLGKLWGFSFVARLASSTTAMLSGFIVASTLTSNFFLGAVWLPLIFWLYLKYRQEKRIRYFIGTVLAIATQTLAACPEISIMTMVLLYAYTLWFMPREEGFAGVARITASLGLAVFLALGLSALQLFPTAKLVSHSIRDSGISYEDHTAWSLEPSKLTFLLMSPGYHQTLDSKGSQVKFSGLIHTIYMGLIGLTLVLLGFCFRREKTVRFWLFVFFLGILLALGRYNPLYEYFYSWMPIVKLFRFPEKYFYISSFAVVFLTGFILDLLTKDPRSVKIAHVLTLLILLFGGVALVGILNPYMEMQLSLSLLFVFGFLYILFYFGKIKRVVFTGLVCFLIIFNLFLKGSQLLPLTDKKFFEEEPLYMDLLGETIGKGRIYSGRIEKKPQPSIYPNAHTYLGSLIVAKQYLRPYTGMIYGVEHVDGLPGLAMGLRDHILWHRVFESSKPERRFRILKRSNVRYWVNQDKLTPYTTEGEPIILPEQVEVFQDALPRSYLVPKMTAPGEGHVLNTYYGESFDPLEKVVLSEPVDFNESADFKGEVKEVTYSPNHVTVKTSQTGNGFLVLMDSYFPGWTVTVDGKEEKVLRANHYYRAVQLEPGEHTLEFDYFPEGFKEGLIVSSIFLLILIALPFCRPITRFQFNPSIPSHSGSEGPLESEITPYK